MKRALPPFINNNSKVLILGTMPGEKSIALQQYYGNPGNYFWKILYAIFNIPFSKNYSDRLSLLRDNNIALCNVLVSCEREGSQDNKIKNEVPNDFAHLHALYPSITHVFFESKAAEKFYSKYCIKYPGIKYEVLPSTSGLNARMSFEDKVILWQQVAEAVK
jgi:hypoxanthine-DNA glycosylase